mmetsp:Transcript_102047/g.304519  ORF Transcript_102047/g.304519 Transcript_102047/m.304519 type:complete len:217 (+) Transcript_102047:520-1170(+)
MEVGLCGSARGRRLKARIAWLDALEVGLTRLPAVDPRCVCPNSLRKESHGPLGSLIVTELHDARACEGVGRATVNQAEGLEVCQYIMLCRLGVQTREVHKVPGGRQRLHRRVLNGRRRGRDGLDAIAHVGNNVAVLTTILERCPYAHRPTAADGALHQCQGRLRLPHLPEPDEAEALRYAGSCVLRHLGTHDRAEAVVEERLEFHLAYRGVQVAYV